MIRIKNLELRIKNYKKIIRQIAFKPERGQIVLILVLVTVVGLTVGLSLISRTVTDIRISSQIEQSSRAFSAAEAGIESALKTATAGETGNVTLSGASADYSVAAIGGDQGVVHNFPFTETSATQTLWLIDHKTDGTIDFGQTDFPVNQDLDICWGSDEANNSALMVTLLYQDSPSGEYRIAKTAYDANASRRGTNNFAEATSGSGFCDGNFKFKQTVSPRDIVGGAADFKAIALRLQPVYTGTAIAIKPPTNQALPVQGKQITSSGQTETGVVRKIQVVQGYNVLPSLFDFAIYTWNASCP